MSEIGFAALGIIPSFDGFQRKLEQGTTQALAAAGKSGGRRFADEAGKVGADEFESKVGPRLKDGAEKVSEAAGKAGGDKFGEAAAKAGGEGFSSKIGGFLKGKAVALGGLAAGIAVGGAFSDALNREALGDKLAGQLGVGAKKSAQLGKVAGQVYAGNYGDSLESVNGAIRSVVTNLDGFRSASKSRLKEVTSYVLDLNAAFDEEPEAITRAASQMVRTGLAKSSKQALDIITKGFQSGANKSEDLLDTFNEYGTQFRKLGIGGKMATGLLSQGLKAGARDADIVADSLKEFSLRTTGALEQTDSKGRVSLTALGSAFQAVLPKGADMYKFQENLSKGGAAGRKGLDAMLDGLRQMKDPLYKSQVAVSLFGTQAEDMGAALYALDPSKAVDTLGKVEGAAKRLDNTLSGNASAKLATFTRSIRVHVVDFLGNEVIPKLEKFADSPGFKSFTDSFQHVSDVATDTAKVVGPKLKSVFDAFNKLPAWVQSTIVLGAGSAALAKKLGGGKLASKALEIALPKKPLPVIVMNPGFGAGGPVPTPGPGGGPGGGGKFLAFLKGGVTPAAAAIITDFMEHKLDKHYKPDGSPTKNAPQIIKNVKSAGALGGWSDKVGSAVPFLHTMGESARQGVENADKVLANLVNSGNAKSAREQFRALRVEADKQGVSIDTLRAKFPKYIDAINNIPKTHPTLLTLPNFVESYRRIQKYGSLLDGLDGRTVKTFIKSVVTNNSIDEFSGTGARFGGHRANGGAVDPKFYYRVNERGEEFFKPNVPGRVVPRDQGGAGGGSEYHFHGIQDLSVMRREVQHAELTAALGGHDFR